MTRPSLADRRGPVEERGVARVAQHVDWRVVVDDRTFRWGYAAGHLIAEWPGILTLRATHGGNLMALEPAPGAPNVLVEKVRHGAAAAFLRAQSHRYSLHASAVSRNGNALVLLGDSGAGKSTLADRLCRRGYDLLADDIAAIDLRPDGWHVLPSEANLWLDLDGSSSKTPSAAPLVATEPALVEWVVLVGFDEAAPTLALRDLRGADAASALFQSLVRFERSPSVFERELEVVSDLVIRTRVLEARRPHDVPADVVAEALSALASQVGR